jgi:hypothetical protein
MTIATYSDLTSAVDAWLGHSLVDSQVSTLVQLFEAAANRRLLTRQMEKTTILVPSNPLQIAVSGAAASPTSNSAGGFLIRLAVASTSLLTTGTEIEVASVNGTTEANGSWIPTVIDGAHIDLQNSTFTNPYVSGGTVQTIPGIASLPSDYLAWRRVTWTGNTRTELAFTAPDYFEATFPTQPADVPRFFTITDQGLMVLPLNSTPLEFDYFQKIPSLQTNSTNWLCTAYPDVYLFGTLCEAETFLVNDERVPMWKARRDEIFDEITQLDLKTRGPSAIRVFGPTP